MANMKHYPASKAVQIVRHGSNANAQRPSGAACAYWYGTVEPVNAIAGDLKSINGTLSVHTATPNVGSPIAWWDFR
jgi:hypothetical protein